MIRKILLLVYLVSTGICYGQSEQRLVLDEPLRTVICDIIQLAKANDFSKIDQKYIHSEFGIYDVFRIGIPDAYEHYNSVAFAFTIDTNPSKYPNLSDVKETIKTSEIEEYNAKYDCNEMVWDREGIFATTIISYPKMSEIIEQPIFEPGHFSESFYQQVKYIEENSYRVVLTKFDIVFYLTKIDEAWYISLFDRVTTDCSA